MKWISGLAIPGSLRGRVQNLFRHDFLGNVVRIFIGTALGQASSVVLAPFLTRLYTPAEFGAFAVFSALIYGASSIATLRYEMAFTLVDEAVDLLNLAMVCGGALMLTTTCVALLAFLGSVEVYREFSLTAIYPYRLILPVGFAAIGAYQIFSFYAARTGDFKTIARTRLLQSVGPVSQIFMGLAHFGALGLALGFVLGQSAGTSLLASRTVMSERAHWGRASLAGCKAIARRFRKFPLISSWSALINTLGTSQIFLIFLSMFYSDSVTGFVYLGDRIIARPLLIISTSILQVYMGEAGSNARNDPGKLRARFLQLSLFQLVIVVSWIGGINLALSYFFVPLFGQRWGQAVPYIQAMSIVYAPQFVVQAVAHTLQVLERQTLAAIFDFGRLVGILLVLLICFKTGVGALGVVLAYAISQSMAYVVLYWLIYRSIAHVQRS